MDDGRCHGREGERASEVEGLKKLVFKVTIEEEEDCETLKECGVSQGNFCRLSRSFFILFCNYLGFI